MNINDFQTKVLSELSEIRKILESTPVSDSPVKVKRERKPRDPNAKPNDWITFTSRVRNALKAADLPAGKECQQFASYLKTNYPDAYTMADEEIVDARSGWTAPPAKPKEASDAKVPPAESAAKPKRTLSDEQKAKMAAGRKAAAERKKAEKEAANTEVAPAPVDKKEAPAPAPAPVPVPAPVKKEASSTLRPLPIKGKKYLWDTETNGLWHNKDGAKGDWAGVLSSDRKSIDSSVPNPDEANDE